MFFEEHIIVKEVIVVSPYCDIGANPFRCYSVIGAKPGTSKEWDFVEKINYMKYSTLGTVFFKPRGKYLVTKSEYSK